MFGRLNLNAGFSARRIWWLSFASLFSLGSLWAVSSPLFSVPDEPSHAVWAAAVSRGQLGGREMRGVKTTYGTISLTWVRVPEIYASSHRLPVCYRGRPNVPADCAPAFSGSKQIAEVPTHVGRYPPAYYFAVGLPSLFFPSAFGLYVMRTVSAALCAALLASAILTASQSKNRSLALGVALAATPTTLFYSGSINPIGVEVAAGIGLWVAAAVLILESGSETSQRLIKRAAVAMAVLILTRPLSPLWAGLTLALVVTAAGLARVRTLRQNPSIQRWALRLAPVFAVAVGWIIVRNPSQSFFLVPAARNFNQGTILQLSLGKTGGSVFQMIGVFGWHDAFAPIATFYLWLAALGALILIALAVCQRRQALSLCSVLALTIMLPVAIEAIRARLNGFGWFGRYTLPIAVGVPILAAVFASEPIDRLGRRFAAIVLGLVAISQALAFSWALRRYMVGVNWFGPAKWQPPVHALALAVAFGVAISIYASILYRVGSDRETTIN